MYHVITLTLNLSIIYFMGYKMENKETKKKSAFGKVCSIIMDILVVPVIILAFACTLFTFSAKANNKVPQIFGKSVVTVLSNSMEPEYKVGDVLIISKVSNLDNLKIGDNIAFYAPIWLGSPFTTTLDNGEKVSNVIYHQIVDIIYPQDANGNKGPRHFVCRGTNLTAPQYYEVNAGEGKYKMDSTGKYIPAYDGQGGYNGNYDIVLESLTSNPNQSNVTTGDIQSSGMSTMQYVTDEYVVGMYDSSLSPAIAGFINFSSSSTGLVCLVIIPAALMLVYVIFSIIREVKAGKLESQQDQLVLEGNFDKLKQVSNDAKQEANEETAKPVAQTSAEESENVDMNTIINTASSKPSVQKVATPKPTATSQTPKVATNKTAVAPKPAAAPKPATAPKPAVAPKAAPKPATAPKVAPKPAATPKAPITPKAPVAKPTAPKAPPKKAE